MKTNVILQGNSLEELKKLPDKSINMVMTSPPYWALRDYKIKQDIIWDYPLEEPNECYGEHPASVSTHEWDMNKEIARFSNDKWKQGNKIIGEKDLHEYKIRGDGFCNKCGAWKGQLGLEPTFDLYIKHLCDIFDEVKRVLRDDGTCWVNLGDTYWGGGQGGNDYPGKQVIPSESYGHKAKGNLYFDKCLVMIPFRFAIEMVNRGWILRNTIIWHKPNMMPSAVKDRFSVDFEYLFFFSKKKEYYFETQYEPHSTQENRPEGVVRERLFGYDSKRNLNPESYRYKKSKYIDKEQEKTHRQGLVGSDMKYNLQGRNKRTVWTINTKPFKEAHFAVYPEELCETPIKAGCPEFVCVKCGNPKIPIFESDNPSLDIIEKTKETDTHYKAVHINETRSRDTIASLHRQKGGVYNTSQFKGYKPTCSCNVGFTFGIVLDPFFGAGTTGLVALKQNKKFIGIELNKEYIEIAKKRLKPFLEQTKLK